MSILSVHDLQGISAYGNTIRIPSGHNLQISDTLTLPSYTTLSLPAGSAGQIVYDSTTKTVKYWNTTTSSWSNIGSGGGGNGTAGDPFTLSTYTVVSSGSSWSIV